jgi:hypothetical protein
MKKIAFLVMGIMLAGSLAGAVTIVEEWTADDGGWTIDDEPDGSGLAPYGGISQATLGGQDALRILGGAADPTPNIDYIFADSTSDERFIDLDGSTDFSNHGALGAPVLGISFDFYANAGGPGGDTPTVLRLYFETTAGVTWYHNITGVTAGWGSYGANISSGGPTQNSGTWYVEGLDTGATWDITQISEIGLYVQYQTNVGSQEYGLDNFTLDSEQYIRSTPEPGTLAMLAMAFGSLGVTFRRKLRETVETVKASLSA